MKREADDTPGTPIAREKSTSAITAPFAAHGNLACPTVDKANADALLVIQ